MYFFRRARPRQRPRVATLAVSSKLVGSGTAVCKRVSDTKLFVIWSDSTPFNSDPFEFALKDDCTSVPTSSPLGNVYLRKNGVVEEPEMGCPRSIIGEYLIFPPDTIPSTKFAGVNSVYEMLSLDQAIPVIRKLAVFVVENPT